MAAHLVNTLVLLASDPDRIFCQRGGGPIFMYGQVSNVFWQE
jgi:hypothetical protein